MAAGLYGFETALYIGAVDPAVAGERVNFIEAGIVLAEEIAWNADTLRGTRSQPKEVTRPGIRRVGGPLKLQPTGHEYAILLPWILGAAGSGTTYALADALGFPKVVCVTRDDGTNGKFFKYPSCQVDRAVFRATRGGPLLLDLDVVGIDETVASAASAPSLALDLTCGPYMFFDLALVVNSVALNCDTFTLTIDNHLDKERFYNSQTLTQVNPTDRTVSLETSVPYSGAEAVYNAGSAGVAATATFTNATVSLLFTMAALVFPRRSPHNQGKSEVMLPIQGQAKQSGATKELVITADTTF